MPDDVGGVPHDLFAGIQVLHGLVLECPTLADLHLASPITNTFQCSPCRNSALTGTLSRGGTELNATTCSPSRTLPVGVRLGNASRRRS